MGSVSIAQENRVKDCIEKANKTIKPWYLSVWWELGFVIQFCIDFFFLLNSVTFFKYQPRKRGKKTNIWILRFKFFVSQKSQLNQRGIFWNGAALGEYQNSKRRPPQSPNPFRKVSVLAGLWDNPCLVLRSAVGHRLLHRHLRSLKVFTKAT